MQRSDIINFLIKKFNYKSYLEIGTNIPKNNFDKIEVDYKVSVDPVPIGKITFIGTSDQYFESISEDTKFDIVFIDGLHHDDQVLKDIENSLNHLNENGTIVCHDCLPTTEDMQVRNDHGREWTGDVWRAIADLRINRIDLDIKVVATDYGCGIIRRGTNVPYVPKVKYLTYDYYDQNKFQMLNVISTEMFIEWINSL